MKFFVVPLALILLLSSATLAQTGDSGNKCQKLNKRTAALVNEYKRLRDSRRRLPQGVFDQDLDRDGGRLSRVLSSLGDELGQKPFTKEIIINCLGAPDAIRSHQQMGGLLGVYNRELRKAGRKIEQRSGREYLIYFWRGWHDFIFFISEGGVIVDHGWWFAYE
jgi:hypothetical protein